MTSGDILLPYGNNALNNIKVPCVVSAVHLNLGFAEDLFRESFNQSSFPQLDNVTCGRTEIYFLLCDKTGKSRRDHGGGHFLPVKHFAIGVVVGKTLSNVLPIRSCRSWFPNREVRKSPILLCRLQLSDGCNIISGMDAMNLR